jgi:protein involved in polysaccharide export with SLBB domain
MTMWRKQQSVAGGENPARAKGALHRKLVLLAACLFVQASAYCQAPPDPATGLVGQPPANPIDAQPAKPATPIDQTQNGYQISPGDELVLHFDYVNELNTTETVRPDGRVDLPLIGSQRAAGQTPEAFTAFLKQAYASQLRRPDLSLNIVKGFASQQVFVGGEVEHPGVQPLSPSLTALEAIIVASGFKDTANPSKVVILRRQTDGSVKPLTIDTEAALDGKDQSQDVALQPFDVVIVPKSAVSSLNQWVDQYIRRNLPFSAGFSYVINRYNSIGN